MKSVHFFDLCYIIPSYLTAVPVRGTGAFEVSKLHHGVVTFLMLSICVLSITYRVIYIYIYIYIYRVIEKDGRDLEPP